MLDRLAKRRRLRELVLALLQRPAVSKPKKLLFHEPLEQRQLMASDSANAMVGDLTEKSSNPAESAIVAPSQFSSFNSSQIDDLSESRLTDSQAKLVDELSQRSKLQLNPSSQIAAFRSAIPSDRDVNKQLIRSPMASELSFGESTSTVTSESVATSSASSLAFVEPEFQSISAIKAASEINAIPRGWKKVSSTPISTLDPVTWTGKFCRVDGSTAGHDAIATFVKPEGEDEDSIVPQIEFPELELDSYSGSLNDYVPSIQQSQSTIVSFGEFDLSSVADPDYTLPGLHWVHVVDRVWNDSNHWSITETLIISFNLANQFSNTETSTSTLSNLLSDGNGSGNSDDQDLDANLHSNTTMDATRNGHYAITFHASKGITTSPTAGVKWSLFEDYSDSISVESNASGGAAFVPQPFDPEHNYTGIVYPEGYMAGATWTASAGISLTSSGINSISSTPTIAGDGNVDRSLDASITYDVDGDVGVGATWSVRSRAGNIELVNYTQIDTTGAGANPLGLLQDSLFNLGENAPEFADESTDSPDDYLGKLGPINGTGEMSASGGALSENAWGGVGGSFNISGVLRNGHFSSLIGDLLGDLQAAKAESGSGYHTYLYFDDYTEPVIAGEKTHTIAFFAGWNGGGGVDATASGGAGGDVTLSTTQEPIVTSPDSIGSAVAVGTNTLNGLDFIQIFLQDTHSQDYQATGNDGDGPFAYTSIFDISDTLSFTSESKGATPGEVNGLANTMNVEADFDSEIQGNGKAELVISRTETTTHSRSCWPMLSSQTKCC